MSENGEGPPTDIDNTIPHNVTPIREGIIPEPNQPPKADNPRRRKLFQSLAVLAGGILTGKVLGDASNKLVEQNPTPATPTTDNKSPHQPMKTFSNSPQFAPTPTEADKTASNPYHQIRDQILNNPNDPNSKIEGIKHPQSTATSYPNTNPHKIK